MNIEEITNWHGVNKYLKKNNLQHKYFKLVKIWNSADYSKVCREKTPLEFANYCMELVKDELRSFELKKYSKSGNGKK